MSTRPKPHDKLSPREAELLDIIRREGQRGGITRPALCAAMDVASGTMDGWCARLRTLGLAHSSRQGPRSVWMPGPRQGVDQVQAPVMAGRPVRSVFELGAA